jgi:hypothetical protein
LLKLAHLRPGNLSVIRQGSLAITSYAQYTHLKALAKAAEKHPELAIALRSHYDLRPDIVIARTPEPDSRINEVENLVDTSSANRTALRAANNSVPILHASVSCKWTLRSDRAQNARTEALNLIRDRKGRAPHIVVVTGEPLPTRVASLALGTGDIDCVYHFALNELLETLTELNYGGAQRTAEVMIEGRRLKDISDLPFDLMI